jgi:hypothetical protein
MELLCGTWAGDELELATAHNRRRGKGGEDLTAAHRSCRGGAQEGARRWPQQPPGEAREGPHRQMRLLRVGRSHWLQQLLSAASHRREMQINQIWIAQRGKS